MFLRDSCSLNTFFCAVYPWIQRLSYFPIVYLMLSNTFTFVSDNIYITVLFFIIPIFQYAMLGSIIGILFTELNKKFEKGDKNEK